MSIAPLPHADAALLKRPVAVAAITETGREPGSMTPAASVPTIRVAVLIVTWNRRAMVERVLNSVARQSIPAAWLDVVVIDNASTDGTLEHLAGLFAPETIVDNATSAAHEPRFAARPRTPDSQAPGNALGLAGLTVIRNTHNLGGCGGFNTGLAYVEQGLGVRPDYVWLVDDDADVAPDTLEHLARAMLSDPDVGLVGSRTVDIRDRTSTIETTIYFDSDQGRMCDNPPEAHPAHAGHTRWLQSVGSSRGGGPYAGVMSVDVVSACSMLARWDAIVGGSGDRRRTPVGFWDHRYFIYCDDADWCLRFGAAGWRVLLALDAVVFHTPWNLKLTPARIYYAQRNRLWMVQKVLPTKPLRRVTRRVLLSQLKDALRASMHRRSFHADIILDTARDAVTGRAGKTGSDGPAAKPVLDALRDAGALRPGAALAVLCSQPESLAWSRAVRDRVQTEARAAGVDTSTLRWVNIVRNDVPGDPGDGAVLYGPRKRSRLKKQLAMLRLRPAVAVVFDQGNDFPILTPGTRHNIHIDLKNPDRAQVERDGWGVRAAFLARWTRELVRCVWYAARVKPFVRAGRYG